MTANKRILGGLAFSVLAALAGRAAAQAPAPPQQTAPAQAPAQPPPTAPAQAPAQPATPPAQPIATPPQPAQAPAQAAGKPAALVNGEPIQHADLTDLMSQMPPAATPLTEAQKREMQQSALNALIEDLLLRQFLRKNAPPVPPADVDKEIAELQQGLQKDKQTLQEYLKAINQTEAQLRADITAHLQWRAYILPRMPDNVIKTYYDTNKLFFDKVFVRASHILIRLA